MSQEQPAAWSKDELRLGILQMLHTVQQKKSSGASGRMLMDCLNSIMFQMQDALAWLREQHLVEVSGTDFLITDLGLDYLIEGLGPGPPTDPSRVPRSPLPTIGSSSIGLPLPRSNENDSINEAT